MKDMNYVEAQASWRKHQKRWERLGIYFPQARSYIPTEFRHDFDYAMDAQPSLITDPNSGIPSWLTTMIDPSIFKVLTSPNEAANIFGENRKGTWLDETAMFPVVEHTGEVSSYGDYATSGSTGVNMNFPQRQSYLFQTIKQYGEREIERAGLARISWVGEIDAAAAMTMNKFQNYTYFFGVGGLQNYGLLNDPGLSAPLSPAPKSYSPGAVKWIVGNVISASANEIYADFQTMFLQLVRQTKGLIKKNAAIVVTMSPDSEVALTATNAFNVNVSDLLKKNFPNIRIETAVQYGALSASNPEGSAGGELVQMFVESVEGQDTGYCAFNEKMRAHRIVMDMSSYKQKVTGGSWGAIVRMPIAISQMIGV